MMLATKLVINDISIEIYDVSTNRFLVSSPHGRITLDGDKLRNYIVRGFSENLKDLLKVK